MDAITDLPTIEELYDEFDKLTKEMSEKDKFDLIRGVTPKNNNPNDRVIMDARLLLHKINLCKRRGSR